MPKNKWILLCLYSFHHMEIQYYHAAKIQNIKIHASIKGGIQSKGGHWQGESLVLVIWQSRRAMILTGGIPYLAIFILLLHRKYNGGVDDDHHSGQWRWEEGFHILQSYHSDIHIEINIVISFAFKLLVIYWCWWWQSQWAMTLTVGGEFPAMSGNGKLFRVVYIPYPAIL